MKAISKVATKVFDKRHDNITSSLFCERFCFYASRLTLSARLAIFPMSIVRQAGQSLTEYSLILGIGLLLAIATLPLLQSNLNSSVQNMVPERKSSLNIGLTSAALNTQHPVDPKSLKTLSFTTAHGNSITLNNIPSGLGNTVLTAGANGTTKLLANSIYSMAKQLLDSKEITQSQYNALVALSNQGHNLANLEGQFESIVANTSNPSDVINAVKVDPELGYTDKDGQTVFLMGYTNQSLNSLITRMILLL